MTVYIYLYTKASLIIQLCLEHIHCIFCSVSKPAIKLWGHHLRMLMKPCTIAELTKLQWLCAFHLFPRQPNRKRLEKFPKLSNRRPIQAWTLQEISPYRDQFQWFQTRVCILPRFLHMKCQILSIIKKFDVYKKSLELTVVLRCLSIKYP